MSRGLGDVYKRQVFIYTDLIKKENLNSVDNDKETPVPKKDRINLQEIDDRLLTIDDFLN